ncbi:MAG: response regulator [Lachnospiraceae bacterium]|nr:response regulator [Lachnospiraceae bacterium]
MRKKDKSIVKWMFQFMVLGVLCYLILGELFLPKETGVDNYKCEEYTDGWYWVKADGSKVPVEIPGSCKVKRNEIVTIENTLPSKLEDNTYLCFRSSKQEMKIYVDGELRQEYSTKDTRLFGKTSAVAYVFLELKPEDAGKIVTIETQTDSSYSGIFYTIYYGEKLGIWSEFFKQYGIELVTGFFMLILGVLCIVGSMILRIRFHKKIELEYLGWGVLLVSIWVIANSVFRQLIFPNVSVIGDMTFFMIMLIAIPFMIYMDGIQKERYHKIYTIVAMIVIINFFLCTILHVTNTKDFADTISWIAVICFVAIFTMGITIIIDICKGKVKEYYLVAIGILGVSLAAAAQIYIYFQRTISFSGTIIAAGLIFLLICSIINTIWDVQNIETEKQMAISSNQSKGKFLANMSHEIRTPINVVLGMDAMILREAQDVKIKEYALDIQNAGQTLLSLINDILDFSKIESGKMEIIPVEYDFSSMIHDIVNMALAKAQNKELDINVSVDQNLPFRLFGDEVRIRQVLVNLMTNAVKYTNEGSVTLSVSGDIQGEQIVLKFAVADTGIGIKEEDIPKLFEEFERIEEKRNRNIEGTGLGMNITTQLLNMMGSHLEVKSVYGQGSEFSFELEQRIVDAEPIGNLDERIKQQTLEYNYDVTFVAPDAKVLVVDDNDINRKVFINLLKETHIQIEEAASGQECLELVFSQHFDLIFLDHMMPEMDGVETLHHMKQKTDYPCKDTPVIVLTANAISGAKEMYLKEGFDEFLSKPIVPEKLEKMIQQMLPEEMVSYEKADKEIKKESHPHEDVQDMEELPVIDGVDWAYGKMHLPDIELLLSTVQDFYRTIDTEAEYLEDCFNQILIEENALDAYRIKVHAMKSSAALIGIVPLAGMAKVLEYAAKDGKMETIQNMTPIFLKEWRDYKEKLRVCTNEPETKEAADMVVVSAYLELLKNAMEDMDIDVADETMNQLRLYQYPEHIEKYMEKLSAAVANLDSEQADALIESIRNVFDE